MVEQFPNLFIDNDGDACFLPSGADRNLVALPARDENGAILNPEIWHGMIAAWNRRADLSSPLAAVKVKPLVWECFDAWTHWARMERGSYYVEERNGRWRLGWCVSDQSFPLMHTDDTMPEDLEAAKAAAQADYDARIRAALEPTPADTSPLAAVAMREAAADLIDCDGCVDRNCCDPVNCAAMVAAEVRALPLPDDAALLRAAMAVPEVAAMYHALVVWDAAHRTGKNEPLQVAFELGQAAIAALKGAAE